MKISSTILDYVFLITIDVFEVFSHFHYFDLLFEIISIDIYNAFIPYRYFVEGEKYFFNNYWFLLMLIRRVLISTNFVLYYLHFLSKNYVSLIFMECCIPYRYFSKETCFKTLEEEPSEDITCIALLAVVC